MYAQFAIHFEVKREDCFDLLCAAHFLGIKPLFNMTSKMVAHNIKG